MTIPGRSCRPAVEAGPEPAAGDDLKSRAVPGDRTSSPGTSRVWRTAGGAIAPETIPDDWSGRSTFSRWVSQGAELLFTCIIFPNLARCPS